MLTGETAIESIEKIRNYIFAILEQRMETSVQEQELDKTDYHIKTDDPRKNVFL